MISVESEMSSSRYRSLKDPETLRLLVRNLREGIYITTSSGAILDANAACLEIFGFDSVSELRGQPVSDLVVDPVQREREFDLLRGDGVVREFELRIRRRDGAIRTLVDTCYLVHDADSGDDLCHGILIDITERKELERELREASIRDPLTGSFNRRYLEELEERLLAGGGPWGVVVVDIDDFKGYNDREGHAAGDDILRRLVAFLNRRVRLEDAVVRLGGDEFVVVLTDDADSTENVARRLTESALADAPVPFSLGWAMREGEESLERTIARADHDLISVKVVGRTNTPRRRRS